MRTVNLPNHKARSSFKHQRRAVRKEKAARLPSETSAKVGSEQALTYGYGCPPNYRTGPEPMPLLHPGQLVGVAAWGFPLDTKVVLSYLNARADWGACRPAEHVAVEEEKP